MIFSHREGSAKCHNRIGKHEQEEAKRRDEEDEQAMHRIKEDNNRRIVGAFAKIFIGRRLKERK